MTFSKDTLYILAPMSNQSQSCIYEYNLVSTKWEAGVEHRNQLHFSRDVLFAHEGWLFVSLENGGLYMSHNDWDDKTILERMEVYGAIVVDDEHIIVTGRTSTKLVNILSGEAVKSSLIGGHALCSYANVVFVSNSEKQCVDVLNKTTFESIDHAEIPGGDLGIHSHSGFGTSLAYNGVTKKLYVSAPYDEVGITPQVGYVWVFEFDTLVLHVKDLIKPGNPDHEMLHYGEQIEIVNDQLVISAIGYDKLKGALLYKEI